MNLDRHVAVIFGAGLGGLVRYVVGAAIMERYGGRFPLGTVVINITGSFLIGFLMTLFTDRLQLHPNWRLLLVTGFLGGYTTFSSFEYETLQAIRSGNPLVAGANVLVSVFVGFVAVWLGALIASR